MKFTPAPANDFEAFYRTYYDRCRQRIDHIRIVAAKWTFEDLIPGLSDFDTRFIVADGMTADDWHAMSLAVGEVHSELARERKPWARNLEHLPGMNLTVSEMDDPLMYYPEFAQWTLYDGDSQAIESVARALEQHQWSPRDELYHLKKIATYFGSYIRGIDPPINLGPWESKYPLHSRYMHYFTPPVQSMVSLKLKRSVRGKFEALRLARELFPNPATIDRVFDAVDRHYEIEADYHDPRLAECERELEWYLNSAWASLEDCVTMIEVQPDETRHTLSEKVSAIPIDPVETFASGVRFARLMEGRLRFYAQDILWFDSIWLIHNELNRIVGNFHDKPLQAYGKARFGEDLSPNEVLDRVDGSLLEHDDVVGMRRFATLASQPIEEGNEKPRVLRVADAYRPVLTVVQKLGEDLVQLVRDRA
jgi:hypothetical protein